MKRFFRILGAILMGFNGMAVYVLVVNASGMIRNLKDSPSSNARTFLCMLAVYGALFVLGYKLYAHGKSGTARSGKGQSPEPSSAGRTSSAHRSTGQENAQSWAEPRSAHETPSEPLPDAQDCSEEVTLYYEPNANRSIEAALVRLAVRFREGTPCIDINVGWNEGYHGGGAGTILDLSKEIQARLTPETLYTYAMENLTAGYREVINPDLFSPNPRLSAWCDLVRRRAAMAMPEKPCEKDNSIGSSQKADGKTPDPTVGAPSDADAEMLPDIACVRAVHHMMCGPWHQYDVLLDARPYGWAMMLDWAAYVNGTDLEQIGTVTVCDMGSGERELVEAYRANASRIPQMPELREERGMLGIGGTSITLKDMVKIVWINQTNTLRLFTMRDESTRIETYVETMVRRTFGTPDAMKRGQKRA